MSPALTAWLGQQHLWLQIAANRLTCNGQLTDADIVDLANIIKDPTIALDTQPGTPTTPQTTADAGELRLIEIGPVEGIDALNPRTPLNLGNRNLVVVYGHNGSGKSGYTRIISRACGKPYAGALKSNVFAAAPVRQMCKIKYSVDGVETEVEWTPISSIGALTSVDVFDTDSGRIYLENETEATFLPPDLSFIADLVTACNRVESVLIAGEQRLVSALPLADAVLHATTAITAYRNLLHTTTEAEIRTITEWTPANEQELNTVNSSLAIADPIVSGQKRRRLKQQREALAEAIDQAVAHLTGEGIETTRRKGANAATKRRIAQESAEALKSKSEVQGVGTNTWRALWKAAREFAMAEAFPFQVFPLVEPGARCVLCHQELSEAARERLASFESYVSGAIEAEAAAAEKELSTHLASITPRPSPGALQTAAQAAELEPQTAEALERIWSALEQNLDPIRRGIANTDSFTPSDEVIQLVNSLRELAASAESEAAALIRSADPAARGTAESRQKELRAKKWISQQAAAVNAEVERLKQVHRFQDWKRQTDTRGLSRKAGELSLALVTEAYIRRFNAELAALGANEIRVELVFARTERGRSKHSIRLRNTTAQGRIAEILSEGERRIISLAASLADLGGRNVRSPFVFDDPISSLDQFWEERVIDRLIELSASRQVIVFTHRMSLLGIISDKAETLHAIYISREPWGTGQPGEVPLDAKKPDRALTDLKNRRLARARNVLNCDGNEGYHPLAKAICSDFRILVERVVEFVLLADVVQRHRRAVNTQGKIHLLARICAQDCNLVDEMMSKYSRYEHSQPNEAPVRPPGPDEIAADIEQLLRWHQEFSARTV